MYHHHSNISIIRSTSNMIYLLSRQNVQWFIAACSTKTKKKKHKRKKKHNRIMNVMCVLALNIRLANEKQNSVEQIPSLFFSFLACFVFVPICYFYRESLRSYCLFFPFFLNMWSFQFLSSFCDWYGIFRTKNFFFFSSQAYSHLHMLQTDEKRCWIFLRFGIIACSLQICVMFKLVCF